MENPNPLLREISESKFTINFKNGKIIDPTPESVFQLLRNIKDPEHPHSLEQLGVISLENIEIATLNDEKVICTNGQNIRTINVSFAPTVPHCSMAGIIGLSILYKLRKFIEGFYLNIKIKEGTHSAEKALNKQLSDKERVLAAFENDGLIEILEDCINEEFNCNEL